MGFLFLFSRFLKMILLVWIEPWHFLPLPQDSASSPSRSHTGNGSVFVNEAALASTSVNNRHVHHRRNDASTHNCLNSLLAQSNGRQPSGAKTPHGQHSDSQGWMMGTGYLYSPAGRHGKNYHKVQFQRHKCKSSLGLICFLNFSSHLLATILISKQIKN